MPHSSMYKAYFVPFKTRAEGLHGTLVSLRNLSLVSLAVGALSD